MNYNQIGSTPIVSTKWVIILTSLFTLMVLSLVFGSAHGQTVKPSDRVLKDTVIRSTTYKLYVGAKGGRYVLRTAKSGLVYKMYIKAKK